MLLCAAAALCLTAPRARAYCPPGFMQASCLAEERAAAEAAREAERAQQQEIFRQQQEEAMRQQQEAIRQQQEEALRQQQEQQEAYRQQLQLQEQQRQQEAYRQQLEQQRAQQQQQQYYRQRQAAPVEPYQSPGQGFEAVSRTPSMYQQRVPYRASPPANPAQEAFSTPGAISVPQGSRRRHAPAVTNAPEAGSAALAGRRPISVGAQITVLPAAHHSGFTINRRNANGSRLVLSVSHAPGAHAQTTAYLQTADARHGTQTRLYLDGHRITIGNGFVTSAAPGRPTITTRADGTRMAVLPNGKTLFRETAVVLPGGKAGFRRVVSGGRIGGQPVSPAKPVTQTFAASQINGIAAPVYQPAAVPAPVVSQMLINFVQPILVSASCQLCPPPDAAFDDAATQYDSPEDLLADQQIDGALQDGMQPPDDGGPGDAAAPEQNDADVAAQMASLQQQLDDAVATNAALKAQLDGQNVQLADLHTKPAAPPEAAAAPQTPMRVSSDVHRQIKREVKQAIAAQVSKSAIRLSDVIASAEAQHYVFQVSDMLDAAYGETGEPCVLTSGDLIMFSEVPGQDDSAAKMKVVGSKADSCKIASVVALNLADLQDMLNAFSQRLEADELKLHRMLAAADMH